MGCDPRQQCQASRRAGRSRCVARCSNVVVNIAIAGVMCTASTAERVQPPVDVMTMTNSSRRLESASSAAIDSSTNLSSSAISNSSSLDQSFASNLSSAGGWRPTLRTLLSPDPSLLVWDLETEFLGLTLKVGWLNVPLYHEKQLEAMEKAPRFCLRVLAIPAADQPAKNGPLLMHCGGPGAPKICALKLPKRFARSNDTSIQHILRNFDVWGIDQRGIGDQWEGDRLPGYTTPPCPFQQAGHSVGAFPQIYCNELSGMSKASILELLGENVSDAVWTTIIAPMIKHRGLHGLTYMDETSVRWYYRLVRLSQNLCYSASRYTKRSPVSGRAFNLLDFSGTSHLAYDIDLFRQAIGANHMSIWGFSYGTGVGSAYASIFPGKVFRMILDGPVIPVPDVVEMSAQAAKGGSTVVDGVASACDNSRQQHLPSSKICPAAPGTMRKVLEMMSKRDERAMVINLLMRITLFARPFIMDVPAAPILVACIEAFYTGREVVGCPFVSNTDTSDGNISARSSISSRVTQIPRRCLHRPGDCVGRPSSGSDHGTGLSSPRMDNRSEWAAADDEFEDLDVMTAELGSDFGFGLRAAVLGVDIAGRMEEDSLIHWWRESVSTHPIATSWAVMWMAGLSTWPALPAPSTPIGSTLVNPVVVGNLHDPQTAYNNAQKMKDAFPGGSLVTWQGYGHCVKPPRDAAATAQAYRDALAGEYTLDAAKLLCLELLYDYMGHGKVIQDGHTCRAPGPVELGQDAAVAMLPTFLRKLKEFLGKPTKFDFGSDRTALR